MLLMGIDIGTSFIKVSVVDASSRKPIVSAQFPENESPLITHQPGWAEQSPEMWWQNLQLAIHKAHAQKKYDPFDIVAIGIAYQMHGLVLVDKDQHLLRDSIIWCDSRAVEIGNNAFESIGKDKCLTHLLNSPGNFTASKLAWVKDNEPDVYDQIYKVMLPGDYIAMRLTGSITTSISALSEGIFWDFKKGQLSEDILNCFGFDKALFPEIKAVSAIHGLLTTGIARSLSLKPGIPVTYKAGDQPNNALSVNVFDPGEVAATAGTSAVIYGVSDRITTDPQSRVNTFAHVNHTESLNRLGILLCINGAGIMNSWIRKNVAGGNAYQQIDAAAASVEAGSAGLQILPFGNGAERVLNNRNLHARFYNIDLNKHSNAHLFRASQEGIAFALRYGLDIMRSNGLEVTTIRAGMANMFKSEVFIDAFVNTTQVPLQLYQSDGSVGAAIASGVAAAVYTSFKQAFEGMTALKVVEPFNTDNYEVHYQKWKTLLLSELNIQDTH